MKKPGIILLAAWAGITACQKKAVPVITERKTPLPKMISSVYPPRETVTPDTLAGRRIYAVRCGKCHALPRPAQFDAKHWDAILPVMFPRAGLDNEQALHVRAWILAGSLQQ